VRRPFIAGNWKMFKTVHETTVYVKELRSLVKDLNDVTVVVAPPFTAVHAAAEAARNSNVAVSAQNMCRDDQGGRS
jgi:triosephosphate isomerase